MLLLQWFMISSVCSHCYSNDDVGRLDDFGE